ARAWERVGPAAGGLVVREDPLDNPVLLLVCGEGVLRRRDVGEVAVGGLEPDGHLRFEDIVEVLRRDAREVLRRARRGEVAAHAAEARGAGVAASRFVGPFPGPP